MHAEQLERDIATAQARPDVVIKRNIIRQHNKQGQLFCCAFGAAFEAVRGSEGLPGWKILSWGRRYYGFTDAESNYFLSGWDGNELNNSYQPPPDCVAAYDLGKRLAAKYVDGVELQQEIHCV